MKKLLALVIAGSSLVSCSTNQPPVEAPVASAPVVVEASAPVVIASAPVITNHNSVYFGFNKYDIKDDYTGLIKANATYLAGDAQAKVQVQGGTDDIGSVEYNLSLGQKRADAVKKALIVNGASKAQVEATSNGKLKPKYENNSSEARAMNRRADINFTAGQPAGYSTDANGLPMVDGSVYNGTVTQGVE